MAPLEVVGGLANRDDRPLGDSCPLDRAVQVVGNRTAILLLREVFYGASRFDSLAKRVGVSEAVAARWLKALLDAGVLAKVPYQQPGQRTRHEYALTEAGHDLMPVVLALIAWGAAWTDSHGHEELSLSHRDCGEPVRVAVVCAAGHEVLEEQVVVAALRKH